MLGTVTHDETLTSGTVTLAPIEFAKYHIFC
jgi:hypothetical protein